MAIPHQRRTDQLPRPYVATEVVRGEATEVVEQEAHLTANVRRRGSEGSVLAQQLHALGLGLRVATHEAARQVASGQSSDQQRDE